MSRWSRRIGRALEHPGDVVLLARVIALSWVVRPLVRQVGVSKAVQLLKPRREGRPADPGKLASRRVASLVQFADPLTAPWTEGACLQRSLVLYRLLNREGLPADLVIGLRSRGDAVDGHAWLALNGAPIFEREDPRENFRATLNFPSPLSSSLS